MLVRILKDVSKVDRYQKLENFIPEMLLFLKCF